MQYLFDPGIQVSFICQMRSIAMIQEDRHLFWTDANKIVIIYLYLLSYLYIHPGRSYSSIQSVDLAFKKIMQNENIELQIAKD
ncbi:MAG: hypothetical protein P8X55_19120, partial [Desulfosarcinaceae bacterium]